MSSMNYDPYFDTEMEVYQTVFSMIFLSMLLIIMVGLVLYSYERMIRRIVNHRMNFYVVLLIFGMLIVFI